MKSLSIAAVVALSAFVAPATVQAHGTLPNGKYNCYLGTTFQYKWITVTGTRYAFSLGNGGRGRLAHAGTRVTFRSGPLRSGNITARHVILPDGQGHTIRLVTRLRDGSRIAEACVNYT